MRWQLYLLSAYYDVFVFYASTAYQWSKVKQFH